jgi:hypothetical protein
MNGDMSRNDIEFPDPSHPIPCGLERTSAFTAIYNMQIETFGFISEQLELVSVYLC